MLPLLNLVPDDTAYVVFVALHVPLVAGLMWLTAHPSPVIRQRSEFGIDAFLIIHVALHWLLSGEALCRFHSSLSKALIFGGGGSELVLPGRPRLLVPGPPSARVSGASAPLIWPSRREPVAFSGHK